MGLIHDPELAYAIEQESARKRPTEVQQDLTEPLPLKADPEAQPARTPPKGGKTP